LLDFFRINGTEPNLAEYDPLRSVRLLEAFYRRRLNPSELKNVEDWRPLYSGATKKFFMLVCTLRAPKSDSTSPSNWQPTQSSAAIFLDSGQIADLFGVEGDSTLVSELGFNQLVFEMEDEVDVTTEVVQLTRLSEIEAIRKLLSGIDFPVVGLIFEKRPQAELPSPYIPIVAPRSLDDISEKIGAAERTERSNSNASTREL
jgi:hypothetical protein